MPRHPPCALKHFNHNKMLASTMQHSTHNHTPISIGNHHAHNERVRNPKPGAALPEKNTNQVSPQDPTVCRTSFNWSSVMIVFHPAASHPRANPKAVRDPQDTESEIRTTATIVPSRYASPTR